MVHAEQGDEPTARSGPKGRLRAVSGPTMAGASVVTAGIAGVVVQQGQYLLGVAIVVVGGVIATAAEIALRRSATRIRSDRDAAQVSGSTTDKAPDMLPAAPDHFVGRVDELRRLTVELERSDSTETMVISSLEGMGGVGKTSMAIHWAHSIGDRFPDGRLYVDLRGFGPGSPMSPIDVMASFLDAFGIKKPVDSSDLPMLQQAYLGLLWKKRILIVLDNARDRDQVEPLIPDTPGSFVIITSRNRMPDLANSTTIALDVLSDLEAFDLIRSHLTAKIVAANPGAVEDIVSICGNLPLALSIVSATAATMPDVPLGGMVDQLRRSRESIIRDIRQADGGAPTFVFEWSYEQLSASTATAFRLLSFHPSTPFSLRAAASLLGKSVEDSAAALDELAANYLVSEHGQGEYAFHDLLRDYATLLRSTTDDHATGTAATRRLVDYYLRSSHAAAAAINPLRKQIRLVNNIHRVKSEEFRGFDDAASWLDHHYLLLLEVIDLAARADLNDHAWQLAWAVGDSIDRNLHWGPLGEAMQVANEAAARGNSKLGLAITLRWLGRAKMKVGAYDDARTRFLGALELANSSGDKNEQALCYHNLALLEEELGRYAEALELTQLALPRYETGKDASGEGRGINAVGWALTLLGRHREAVEHCDKALGMLRQIGDRQGQADTLDSLGHAYRGLGDLAASVESYRRAVAMYAEIGNLPAEAATLEYLGAVFVTMGEHGRAAESWRHALKIKRDLGLPGAEKLLQRLEDLRGARFPRPIRWAKGLGKRL
ncbi:ATP-binding protein [Actinoplanes xinjiangensis]|uniref:Tetratricopeptide (TPR) repeat protein n=1 Tax=Actinoplanes xinjiangensis TaxID=512350 RepID=A0A316FHN5_9ACTN|nr:tetratricopeptide repeat protein [Actinoplanes xinjiangensis]PWK47773.1 tetratricopeptide (TPR) repeat protein [Actinoplanes xinjiangensis]GIF39292.1 hypothetical protein Axi01nite_36030 [Actinoplanes xinjiangensis]